MYSRVILVALAVSWVVARTDVAPASDGIAPQADMSAPPDLTRSDGDPPAPQAPPPYGCNGPT